MIKKHNFVSNLHICMHNHDDITIITNNDDITEHRLAGFSKAVDVSAVGALRVNARQFSLDFLITS